MVESFAARSGYSALLLGILAGVDRVIIPEAPYDPLILATLVRQDKRENPANYAVVLVTDGAKADPAAMSVLQTPSSTGGHARSLVPNSLSSGETVAAWLQHLTGEEAFVQQLTYLLRTGAPDGQDLLGAANFAFLAAELAHTGTFGRMTAFIKERMWTDIELNATNAGTRQVDLGSMYDADNYKPRLELIWSLAQK